MKDIAIIGLTGRFPGARNIEEFWHNLRDGVESITPLSEAELDRAGVPKSLYSQENYVKAAPILQDDIAEFDAAFFGFSPREAELLDPQQRLFLELAWEALETSGYSFDALENRVGLFGGVGRNTYLLFNVYPQLNRNDSVGASQTLIGNDKDFLTTRVSYLLDLTGPSVTLQTACSTSLVAVHFACQSLLSGESDVALAGGVSLKVPHYAGYLYQEGGIYAPDGHCRSFDAKAKGTVGGSGAGIVVLKRLEDAIADRNFIHAVIKGTAVNNDGAIKVGYTAPSVEGQASAIAEALFVAEIDPTTIQYVEAHGTATPLGDPIELQALAEAFWTQTQAKGFCALGSVKSNVGHLDAAAGVTGLIKTVLALKHEAIPPSLHFEQGNPEIDFANSPFYVNTRLTPWARQETPRRAGVSSFGIGGTNAHVVLEEAPIEVMTHEPLTSQILLLSAKTASALDKATENLRNYLQDRPNVDLADVAYTLQKGRKAFEYRRMVVAETLEDAIANLQNPATLATHHCDPPALATVFLFPGQGSQYPNMGKDLYESEPEFKQHLDRCCELFQPWLKCDLRDLLYPENDSETAADRLKQTVFAQSALFAVEYSLAMLLQSWGIRPAMVIGHSIGEYVAACVAGIFALEDAIALVAQRGQLMQTLPPGAMLSVALSPENLDPFLSEDLSVAAINAPQWCVVSGEKDAIAALHQTLRDRDIRSRLLSTSHAFHSAMMDPILAKYQECVENCPKNAPQIPLISNLTGTWLTDAEAIDSQYWAQHLRQTVRFAEGVTELLKDNPLCLEVGPGRTLSTFVQQQDPQTTVVTSMRHPQAQISDRTHILNTLGQLWLAGMTPNWQSLHGENHPALIPLPTYPFERKRYWIEADHPAQTSAQPEKSLAGTWQKAANLEDWFYLPTWVEKPLLPTLQTADRQSWLIFADESAIAERLIAEFRKQQHACVVVRIGERFTLLDSSNYAIAPQEPKDYLHLIRHLQENAILPQNILHTWSLAADCRDLDRSFYSLLFLARALGEQQQQHPTTLTLLSSQLYDVVGTETLCPEKATLQGPCRVIPQEFPQISCKIVDIEPHLADPSTVVQLYGELTAKETQTLLPFIAYRQQRRWVQTIEPFPLPTVETPSALLKEGGTYLITGGLGGIGLTLAETLAQTVRAQLILIGRKGLPDREDWSDWLATEGEDDPIGQKIRKIQQMESWGARVLVLSADSSDEEQMQEAIAIAEEHFGSIHGVIHTAGVAGGRSILLKTREQANTVLAAKVTGTRILERLFANKPLDFTILNSSVSSFTGGLGQIDYCAANAFLDAFARQHQNSPTIAIDWDTWQTVGMAANTAVPEQLRQHRKLSLELGLTPAEGMEVFHRILAHPRPHYITSTKDLRSLLARSATLQSREQQIAFLNNQSAASEKESNPQPRPNLKVAYTAPRTPAEAKIAEIWQNCLGFAEIGIHDDFFELGGHSLLATQLISRLRQAFEQEIPLSSIFETPTIAGLAPSLEQESDRAPIQPRSRDTEHLSSVQVDALLQEMLDSHQEPTTHN